MVNGAYKVLMLFKLLKDSFGDREQSWERKLEGD